MTTFNRFIYQDAEGNYIVVSRELVLNGFSTQYATTEELGNASGTEDSV